MSEYLKAEVDATRVTVKRPADNTDATISASYVDRELLITVTWWAGKTLHSEDFDVETDELEDMARVFAAAAGLEITE